MHACYGFLVGCACSLGFDSMLSLVKALDPDKVQVLTDRVIDRAPPPGQPLKRRAVERQVTYVRHRHSALEAEPEEALGVL